MRRALLYAAIAIAGTAGVALILYAGYLAAIVEDGGRPLELPAFAIGLVGLALAAGAVRLAERHGRRE